MNTLSWLVLLATTSAPTDIVTFDSSAYGKTPAGWRASVAPSGTSPSWKVVKDPTAPSQPYVLAHVPDRETETTFPMVLLDRPPCKDGEISVKYKTAPGKQDNDAGLVWRYRDPGNYYVARADAQQNNVVLYRVVDGKPRPLTPRGRTQSTYAVPHNVSAGGWGILKVVFRGPAFSVYCDHRRVLRVEDSAYLGPGQVGLWTREDTLAYFDNFRFVPRQ